MSDDLIDPADASPNDLPIVAATKQSRALIEKRFGRTLTRRLQHTPHALRKSIVSVLEAEYAESFRRTASNRFRSVSDISVSSSLAQYYSYNLGHSVPGSIRYRFQDITRTDTVLALDAIRRDNDLAVFCLNRTDGEICLPNGNDSLVSFLQYLFPVPSLAESFFDPQHPS